MLSCSDSVYSGIYLRLIILCPFNSMLRDLSYFFPFKSLKEALLAYWVDSLWLGNGTIFFLSIFMLFGEGNKLNIRLLVLCICNIYSCCHLMLLPLGRWSNNCSTYQQFRLHQLFTLCCYGVWLITCLFLILLFLVNVCWSYIFLQYGSFDNGSFANNST